MIIVDKEIEDRVVNYQKYSKSYEPEQAVRLIESFIKDNLQSASYDLTISNKINIFKNQSITLDLTDKMLIESLNEEVDITYGYNLSPQEYIISTLNEKINMPKDLSAHIRPRTTFTRLGLILVAQHINPTYSGVLSLGLYNASPYVIKLIPNIVIGQIVFEQLSGEPIEEKLYRYNTNSKYHNESGLVGSKVFSEMDIKYLDLFKDLLSKGD